MILGRDVHVHAACFDEINTAVEALTDRVVCFNAHHFPAPPGAVIYNLENVPGQVDPAIWAGHECWDFNAANAARYGATHVPVGYHPSMQRFGRAADLDIDVVFAGSMNSRREVVLHGLSRAGLNVVVVPHAMYGAARDNILCRAKLALNMQYYDDGAWPALRAAHLVANRVPMLSEAHPDCWPFVASCPYMRLIDVAVAMIRAPLPIFGCDLAERSFEEFRKMPMVIPG